MTHTYLTFREAVNCPAMSQFSYGPCTTPGWCNGTFSTKRLYHATGE